MMLLVVGAGAFFGKVISATGIGTALADTMSAAGLPVIVLAYLISCGLRVAQGSATVAIVTTGGIVGPAGHRGRLLPDRGRPDRHGDRGRLDHRSATSTTAASGSSAKYFNMTVKHTLKTWTVLETVLSVVGFAVAAALFAVFA